MAKSKQLPSGSWRVQVFAGTGPDGKRQYKSFTAPTERKATLAALEWQEHYRDVARDTGNMTLREGIEAYIKLKSNVLSPSTLFGYDNVKRNRLQGIMDKPLNKMTADAIKKEINREAGLVSAKTVHNASGLLSAVMREYRPDFRYEVSLPQKKQYQGKALNRPQIASLMDTIRGNYIEIPILLAMWLGLRRSEIAALKWTDIDLANATLTVSAAKVPSIDDGFVIKGPKTVSSGRTISIPLYILDRLNAADKTDEFVLGCKIANLERRWMVIRKRAGIGQVRLHDLRHTMASVGLLLGIPDKYIMERGGWSTINTVKKIYQHTLQDGHSESSAAMDAYFEGIISHDMQHDAAKT